MSEVDARPEGARVTGAIVGSSTGPQPVAWGERDVMLYAIGVGAGLGDPARELMFTTENSSGLALNALPSFLTVLAAGLPPAMATLDIGRFLHIGQSIELTRPIPASGHGSMESKVVEVLDKGSGAIVSYEGILHADDGGAEPIGRIRSSIFVRGGGGFGGPRGSSTAATVPSRPPDQRVEYASRPEQALIYRLSGDRHRLHSDPRFAHECGFERPILHGLCTYGYACRALIEGAAAGNPTHLHAMDARFAKPVYPGQTLTTEIWVGANDKCFFRTLNETGEAVLDGGTARITA